MNFNIHDSYPDYDNLPAEYDEDQYETFFELNYEENITKLLGWADSIQSEMETECELLSAGYSLDDWSKIPKEAITEAEKNGKNNWRLLFQLDTVRNKNFELMFGDSGRIYFWIRKEDLLKQNFDKVRLILQCY